MNNEYISNLPCILCGSENAIQLSDKLRKNLENKYAMRPHKCVDCGFVFMNPLMSVERENSFYEQEYRDVYHGAGYDIDAFHVSVTPDMERRIQMLKSAELLNGTLIDFGSSTGRFIELAKDNVNRIIGVEPNERQRAYANEQNRLTYSSLQDVPSIQANVITMFHVLEHIRNPIQVLKDLQPFLAPDGVIIVEVPNVEDALISKYAIEEFATYYWHPAHSYYFSPDTLRAISEKAGYKAELIPVQRYGLNNHLQWLYNRVPGILDTSELISESTNTSYRNDLCERFICDTIWAILRLR